MNLWMWWKKLNDENIQLLEHENSLKKPLGENFIFNLSSSFHFHSISILLYEHNNAWSNKCTENYIEWWLRHNEHIDTFLISDGYDWRKIPEISIAEKFQIVGGS